MKKISTQTISSMTNRYLTLTKDDKVSPINSTYRVKKITIKIAFANSSARDGEIIIKDEVNELITFRVKFDNFGFTEGWTGFYTNSFTLKDGIYLLKGRTISVKSNLDDNDNFAINLECDELEPKDNYLRVFQGLIYGENEIITTNKTEKFFIIPNFPNSSIVKLTVDGIVNEIYISSLAYNSPRSIIMMDENPGYVFHSIWDYYNTWTSSYAEFDGNELALLLPSIVVIRAKRRKTIGYVSRLSGALDIDTSFISTVSIGVEFDDKENRI